MVSKRKWLFATVNLLILFASPVSWGEDSIGCSTTLETFPGGHIGLEGENKKIQFGSGEKLGFYVNISSKCYWALYWKNSFGDVFNVAPWSSTMAPNQDGISGRFRIPTSKNQFFVLDKHVGIETIYLIYSKNRIENLNHIGRQISLLGQNLITAYKFGSGIAIITQQIDHLEELR